MKNSVKFFVGGIIAATLIFGAFAFTTKQKESMEYLVIRVHETTYKGTRVFYQVCDKNGIVEFSEDMIGGKKILFEDEKGGTTMSIAKFINKYSEKGYKLSKSDATVMPSGKSIYTTLIFEK